MQRVIVYMDGFNLYHGLRAAFGRRFHWLDVEALASSLLRPGQALVSVRYFTALVRDAPLSAARQRTYLSALRARCAQLEIHEGRFQRKSLSCRACGAAWTSYEEKESDVSLALGMAVDAARDRFDTALLVSADADLGPAIRAVRDLAPRKRVVVAFPPARHSAALQRIADGFLAVGADKVRQAQLPDKVSTPSGGMVQRPAYWR